MSASNPSYALAAVHVPKTAGTSFQAALREYFGQTMRLDYDDKPLSHARWPRRLHAVGHAIRIAGQSLPASCVYGHYLPLKYSSLRGVRFCTWLRDPVQRVISRYHHYRRHVNDEPQHARHGLTPGLTLEQFVRLPQYQDSYAEYFWGFPLGRFDFIGIVEHHAAELERFARVFRIDVSLVAEPLNRNPETLGQRYEVDAAIESLIRECNPRDVRIYQRALEMRAHATT